VACRPHSLGERSRLVARATRSARARAGSAFQISRAAQSISHQPSDASSISGLLSADRSPQVRFSTTANGKPELAADSDLRFGDLRFNLSHTEGVTVFAIARHRQLGIDVERIRPDTNALELAERFFSHPEVQWLRLQPASEQIPSFFTCWTGKEAYIKAHGAGLSISLNNFGVLPVRTTAGSELQLKVYENPQETRRWSMWPLELGSSLRAALAVEGESCRVRLGQWPLPDVDGIAR